MAWSESRQLALALLPKFSSVFSFVGSLWISIEVLTGYQVNNGSIPNRYHPYHRLLLAMSTYDMLECGWNFLSTWPIPRGTEGVWNPVGTTALCSAQGFFLQFSIAVPIYNAMLALYYVLVVNYRTTDTVLRRKVEPVMHAVAGIWSLGTSLIAVSTGMVNNANLWCWIAPYPAGCLDSRRYGGEGNCERGDNAWIYRWVLYFAPLWFCILFAAVCTAMVVTNVKKLDEKTVLFRKPERSESIKSIGSFRNIDDAASSSVRSFNEENNSAVAVSPIATHPGPEGAGGDSENEENPVVHWWKRRKEFAANNPRTVQVQAQAFYYVVVFFLTHIFSTVNRIIQQSGGETYYGLVVLHSFFDPLQGFLNFIVYQRPRYVRARKENPTKSRWHAIQLCFQLSRFTHQVSTASMHDNSSNHSESVEPKHQHRRAMSTENPLKKYSSFSASLAPIHEVGSSQVSSNSPQNKKAAAACDDVDTGEDLNKSAAMRVLSMSNFISAEGPEDPEVDTRYDLQS